MRGLFVITLKVSFVYFLFFVERPQLYGVGYLATVLIILHRRRARV